VKTFEQFLAESVQQGGFNIIYEAGMYALTNDVEQIINALRNAGVEFEVVGGVAVNAHIYAEHRSRSFVTRDIDILIHRHDLDRAAKATEASGAEAIHLLFAGEKSKSTQPLPHPEVHPEERLLVNIRVPVAPLQDLLQMKLSSLRPKDLVHLEILDEAGLITPTIELQLPPVLQERLQQARKIIAENQPDVEG